jgi:integrase
LAVDALLSFLRGTLGEKTISVHGLRASFSSFAADHGFAPELAEISLGHSVGTTPEKIYQRSDMLERRKALMERWSAHCGGSLKGDNVVAFKVDAPASLTPISNDEEEAQAI